MSPLLVAVVLPLALFCIFLAGQAIFKSKYCALCLAVSGSWFILLALYLAGRFNEPRVLAVLMGESAVGLYYLLQKKLAEKWQIFRVPFLLSLTVLILALLGLIDGIVSAVLILLVTWLIGLLVFALRQNQAFKKIAERLMACCRDW